MFNIGCHLSTDKGYEAMGKEALKIHANTFQFFTRNPQGGSIEDIDPADAASLTMLMEKHNFAPLLAHAPYTLNLCSSRPQIRNFGRKIMSDDLNYLKDIPCQLYNFHPGSRSGQDIETAIMQIAKGLNKLITPDLTIYILLETMSGKGSEVGGKFEELREIIDRIELKDKIGVCLDTCHIYDAGYDIVNDLEGVITHFDKVIGLNRLKSIHLNDSMNALGSHKDRHAKLGEGNIGLDTFARIINHPALHELPFLLETPNDTEGYAREIKILRELYRE